MTNIILKIVTYPSDWGNIRWCKWKHESTGTLSLRPSARSGIRRNSITERENYQLQNTMGCVYVDISVKWMWLCR